MLIKRSQKARKISKNMFAQLLFFVRFLDMGWSKLSQIP